MLQRFAIVLVFCVFVSSCATTKKVAKTDAEEENLETVEITASRENPYRGSATKDFDLVHTKLEVKFDYAKQHLSGKATITLKPHFYPQKELTLDAKQYDIHDVSLVSSENVRSPLQFTYDSSQLKIQLNKEYTRDEQLKVYIDYTAKPNERKSGGSAAINDDKGLYFINPGGKDSSKPIQIWTQGETESNSCWFPTIDKPNQKTTDEIYITHLKKYVCLSNGTLISSTSIDDSTVTDYWRMGLPHAPYLFMMAIGDFAIIKDRWRDVPVDYYVEKEYAPYAKQIFGNTPQMMEFFSQKLGFDFPWPKYSQVVVRDYVSGAMENTSATLHGEFMQRTSRELLDETHEEVISHELFHQWFGDLVSPESWSNVPLNESFATYGEYLWNEYKYGREFADSKFHDDYRKYIGEAKEKNVDLIRFHYEDREDMFDNHSYAKGGLVLHYLRKVVGDDAFFKSLELYLKNNQFKAAEIHLLRLAFEEVTGQDLNWFFNEWFLNSGHPVLNINYSYDRDSVYVTIEQKHNIEKDLVYRLPFKIAIWQGKTVSTYDVVLKKKSQVFAFKSSGKPDLVDFDPEYSVLCERKDNKTADNYIFEYKNALYFPEKYEAMKKLGELQKQNSEARDVLIQALNDKFPYFRRNALLKLELPKENSDTIILAAVQNLARNDKESSVRKAALEKLTKSSSASKYTSLFETMVSDSSYEVAGAALKALDDVDSKKGLQTAKLYENEKNVILSGAVADVYSKEGDSDYQAYFESKLKKSNGLGAYGLLYYYANFLTRMDKKVVLAGMKSIEEKGMNSDSHYVISAASGSMKRIVKSFEEKKKKAQADLKTETGQTAKIELQEQINDSELILNDANDAVKRLEMKSESKKD